MSNDGKKLRNVRARQAIKAFERLGYQVVRIRGSHYILKHPEKGMLVLPFHQGAMKIGIILDALDKAGISVEEFEEFL